MKGTSFASAHVFPGGNLDAFHDGEVPPAADPARHADGEAYRRAAVRECFEESGILLARRADGSLLDVQEEQREAARAQVHRGEIRFGEWVERMGGSADLGTRPFPFYPIPCLLAPRGGGMSKAGR